jgi:superfamily II DNA or RNA helicase
MLRDIELKNMYSSGIDEPKEFFTEALVESKTFDLGLGFFSSSGIRSLSYGFALFIANGGKMRVVINQVLSAADKAAIEKGQSQVIDNFEEKIIVDINRLAETLSKADEQFFRCFSYLISINRIEFVATVSTKGGLAHDKYGVFTDLQGNKIAFIGSANFSKTALELNGETITVFSSWNDSDRVSEFQNIFNESWKEDTSHLIHIPLNEVKTHIEGKFPPETVGELIQHGIDLRDIENLHETSKTKTKSLSPRLIEKLEQKEQEPRFPFPEEREIQKNAYAAWIANNRQGIFAMATGSGKTVTALNCVLKRYQEDGFYKVIIAVPTQALAMQWEQEVKAFNFQNIASTHTNKDWKETLGRYTTKSIFDKKKNLILITTYATFNRKDIQAFLKDTQGIDSFIYIADEAHNIGSTNTLKHLPEKILQRIGLSATPERIYDDVGSEKLYQFFNSRPPQYTYRYTMKEAIWGKEDDDNADKKTVLCHYDYFPIFVELTDYEMIKYQQITKKLSKFIDPQTGKYKKEAEKLLLKRKRVIHKAHNKKEAITNLLEELKSKKRLDYTFVFVPEGYEPDYAEADSYQAQDEDIHIIDEYANMFKEQGYSYHKYISGLEDAQKVLTSFADGDIKILLSMKCLDEGVDIPRAEHAIFCSSTGNPRQFVQRRGRVLRKSKGKKKATIWDLIVTPPNITGDLSNVERNMFIGEVSRIVNFAALADNEVDILYGDLKNICEQLGINLFDMLDEENKKYK